MSMANQGLWLANGNCFNINTLTKAGIFLQQLMCLLLAKRWFRCCVVLYEASHQGTKGSMPASLAGRGQVTVGTADSRLGGTDWQQTG